MPDLETRASDITTVMDAVDWESAHFIGFSEGGLLGQFFAAEHTKAGDVDIAHRVAGSGPIDVVWVPGLVSNLEILWKDGMLGSLYRRLAKFARSIAFDKLGMGLSDGSVGAPTLDERMERAAGSPRAISVPTLVVHTRDDLTIPIDNGRWLAENIPGARFFEMEGSGIEFEDRGEHDLKGVPGSWQLPRDASAGIRQNLI